MVLLAQPTKTAAKKTAAAKPAAPKAAAPALGSPEWEKTLHPKVQQFMKHARKLDWSKV
jgi:hypothetical protein